MSYNRTVWVDEETPVDADNLNNIEEGVTNLDRRVTRIENESAIDSCYNIIDPHDGDLLKISLLTTAEYEELERQGQLLEDCYYIFRDDKTIENIYNAISLKQNRLEAGDGIEIVGNVISVKNEEPIDIPQERGVYVKKLIVDSEGNYREQYFKEE